MSAEAGYAMGQTLLAEREGDRQAKVAWLEKAVAQGEPQAMAMLASLIGHSAEGGVAANRPRAEELWWKAAMLGDESAQFVVASEYCVTDSVEQFEWLRRSMMQRRDLDAIDWFDRALPRLMNKYDETGSGRLLFEIGAALASTDRWQEDLGSKDGEHVLGLRAVKLYHEWCAQEKRGVMCWLWLSRLIGVSKDVRIMIAGFIWTERAAWSDRPALSLDPIK